MSTPESMAVNERMPKMRTKKGKATTGGAMAKPTQNAFLLAIKSYHNCSAESIAKLQIGEILIFGNKQRKEFWWLFELELRAYVDLKISGGSR
jgi:hypothetical protein